MPTLEIDVEESGARTVIRLGGEFDISGVRSFHRAVTGAEGALVIDLRGLTFIGAAGVRSLIELQRRSRRDGFDLLVVKGSPLVHRVFELTGVDQRLEMIEG